MPARIERPPMGPDESFCTHCRLVKPRSAFWRNKKTASGLALWCGACLTTYCIAPYERKNYRRRRDSQALYGRKKAGRSLAPPVKARFQTWEESNLARRAEGARMMGYASEQQRTVVGAVSQGRNSVMAHRKSRLPGEAPPLSATAANRRPATAKAPPKPAVESGARAAIAELRRREAEAMAAQPAAEPRRPCPANPKGGHRLVQTPDAGPYAPFVCAECGYVWAVPPPELVAKRWGGRALPRAGAA